LVSNEVQLGSGCRDGEETTGVLQLRSTDWGLSYSRAPVPLRQLGIPVGTPRCISPTSGAGVQLRVGGPRPGRLVASAVENVYRGDVVLFSDDGGLHWNASEGLHLRGIDESQVTVDEGRAAILPRQVLLIT
jgi:hypothetical protein